MLKHFFERSSSSQSVFRGLLEQIEKFFFMGSKVEHRDEFGEASYLAAGFSDCQDLRLQFCRAVISEYWYEHNGLNP
jgi:hypothetical protein